MSFKVVKHLVIILALLIAASTKASSEPIKIGDIFYCSSATGSFAEAPYWESANWKNESFRFEVASEDRLIFGAYGFLKDHHFNLTLRSPESAWIRGTRNDAIFNLQNGRFSYAKANGAISAYMTGTCDKF